MRRFFATLLVLAAAARPLAAALPDTDLPWTNAPTAGVPVSGAPPVAASGKADASPSPSTPPATKPASKVKHTASSGQTQAQMQAALDQLTQTNHDLLDLLKKQQAILEDMQFNNRLQGRQIGSLEERLEEALTDKRQLEQKVDNLEVQASGRPTVTAGVSAPTPVAPSPAPVDAHVIPAPPTSTPVTRAPIGVPIVENVPSPDNAAPAGDATPPPPASYLPPAGGDGPAGSQTWHRLITLKGGDNRQTDVFLVRGKTWRVLWHNQDKPGKLYANTSALFVNAFPRDDTIPQKVCAKLGSGGDSTELPGPGYYYLKIEASGGSWELAVEDFR